MIDTDWPDYKPRTPRLRVSRVRVVRRRLVDQRWLGVWFALGIGIGMGLAAPNAAWPASLVLLSGAAACGLLAALRSVRIMRGDDERAEVDIGGPRPP